MKRIIATLVLLAVSAQTAIAANLPKLRVGYVPEPAHGLYFVARDKGYFKQAGSRCGSVPVRQRRGGDQRA
jgi:NitT/TauT family transport system substrate-binding protein